MENIAIVRRNGLGDLLCAFPLVLYLKKYKPSARITLFVDKRNAPLLNFLPKVDEVVVFPGKGNKYFNAWTLARRYQKKFDIAFSAKTSPMKLMNFFLYWLKAKKRVAYVDKSWHSRLINHPLIFDPLQSNKQHQALKDLKMVAPELKEVPEELYPKLLLPFNKKSFSFPPSTILISVTTTKAANRLNEIRYSHLLNQLHKLSPIHVLIIGQSHDHQRAHAIARGLKAPYTLHFPRNFEEFMIFLDAADFYFVADGGVAHMGAALGKRGVVLYGQTNPLEWHPLTKKMETLYHPRHVNFLSDDMIFDALKRIH